MRTHTHSASHLRDAELMRLVDGEELPAERARNAAHLAACARCAGEVERMRADAATVRAWLDRAGFEESLPAAAGGHAGAGSMTSPADLHDAESQRHVHIASATAGEPRPAAAAGEGAAATHHPRTPSRRPASWFRSDAVARPRLSPWLRAAAVIALLATPVAAVPALRERLVDTVATFIAADPAAPAPAAAREDTGAAPATLWFEPAAGAFTVAIDLPQTSGTLRLEQTTGEDAVLQIGGAAGAGPIVSASSLHIRNSPDSEADYLLQVPAAITSVTVRIAGRVAAVLDASAVSSGVELPVR